MEQIYDYREGVEKILQTLTCEPQVLKVGATAIRGILEMSFPQSTLTATDANKLLKLADTKTINEIISRAEPQLIQSRLDELKSKSISNADEHNDEQNTKAVKPKILKVERLRKGFDLIDSINDVKYHYDEIMARMLGVTNHDLVKVDYTKAIRHNTPYICKIVQVVNDPNDFILTHYWKVEVSNNKYYVQTTYNGTTLKSVNPNYDYYQLNTRLVNQLKIKEGQLLDLAWYADTPSDIVVSYVYPETGLSIDKPVEPSNSKSKNTTAIPDSKPVLVSTLAFNLQGKHVGIIVGDELRRESLKRLVQEHHGRLTMIDAFKHVDSTNFYNRKIKNKFDLIVMVQNQNKHATSKALNKAVKKYHLKMAISDGLGIQQIERAIYRALNNYPAYESSAHINYPLLSN